MKNPSTERKMNGFTLVETLVAVAILALAIAGPMYNANVALVAAEESGQELTASYLAQEGIEYVRAYRDHEYLANYTAPDGTGWNAFTSSMTSGTTYQYDPTMPMGVGSGEALQACSGQTCKPLYVSVAGLYTQTNTGVPTPFTRTIVLTTISPTEVRVSSSVQWTYHTMSRTVTVSDNLTAWQ